MPGMDGIECARQLGDIPAPPLVLMVSALARDELLRELERQQVAVGAVLSKPVMATALAEACAVALGEVSADAERSTPQADERLAQRERLRGARVLLVEDNAINQELAVELLSGAGIAVSVADNGEQALAMLAAEPFDLVLMDCQLPVMDGYEATRALRRDSRWRELPVIAMTANAMFGDREKALAAGMDDHVPKPVDVDRLFATLLRWMPDRPGAA
jgi:CheY-like chemotaxis protein